MTSVDSNHHCVLTQILEESAQNKNIVCVFDLDSTLFNVSTRTQRIIFELSQQILPELKDVEILQSDWGIREALHRHGFSPEKYSDLHTIVRDFWVERFFSNEYLHYDVPYLGAVAFVQKLSQTKTHFHFLTGRDEFRMGHGTREVLKKWGFPVTDTNVHLKPDRSLIDHEYKLNWVNTHFPFEKHPYEKIYFFENEPVNVNRIYDHRQDLNYVFMHSTHSGQQELTTPAHIIHSFELKTAIKSQLKK